MRYDFTKVHNAMADQGLTLTELAAKTRESDPEGKGVSYSTIGKALTRGTAHQSTARLLCAALGISMRSIRAKRNGRAA